jgi:hypothetical protein
MSLPHRVTVTVNGTAYKIEPGVFSFREFAAAVGHVGAKTATITTAHPVQPTTVNGNDSLEILGGEAFTIA